MPKFFAKTDRSPKKRFFNPVGFETTDDVRSNSDGDAASTETAVTPFIKTKYNQYRLQRPRETLEDLLERLLRNAQNANGESCEFYLQELINFLTRNPDLVNRAPNQFKSNPLELVIKLGYPKIIQELLSLKANVRPEHRYLLEKMKQLLSIYSKENSPTIVTDLMYSPQLKMRRR